MPACIHNRDNLVLYGLSNAVTGDNFW